jgi:hypothetical protein
MYLHNFIIISVIFLTFYLNFLLFGVYYIGRKYGVKTEQKRGGGLSPRESRPIISPEGNRRDMKKGDRS